MDLKNFEKPEYFVNRELSWLKFDDRVLSEARDKSLPLFERLKFTSIVSSNLDEFYINHYLLKPFLAQTKFQTQVQYS